MSENNYGDPHPLYPDMQKQKVEFDKLLARVYCDVLAKAEKLYKQGGDAQISGLAAFDRAKESILHGWKCVVDRLGEDKQAAEMCLDYAQLGARVCNLRLSPHQQIQLCEAAIKASKALKDQRKLANAIGNLGLAYHELGNYRKAIEQFRKQLALAKKIEDKGGVENALANLGRAYLDMGKKGTVKNAIGIFEQALAIIKDRGRRAIAAGESTARVKPRRRQILHGGR